MGGQIQKTIFFNVGFPPTTYHRIMGGRLEMNHNLQRQLRLQLLQVIGSDAGVVGCWIRVGKTRSAACLRLVFLLFFVCFKRG